MTDSNETYAWFAERIAEAAVPPPERSVTPGRYPFTYAYDYLRTRSEIFGAPKNMSRGDTASWMKAKTGWDGARDDRYVLVCRMLADALIAEERLVWPEGTDVNEHVRQERMSYYFDTSKIPPTLATPASAITTDPATIPLP